MKRHVSIAALLLIVAAAAACGREPVAPKTIRLDIPDTGQETRQPASGWCGEATIQMALSYYGVYASQQAINRAGKPEHPDLYENDIPVAMKALGMEFQAWRGEGMQPFLKWVRDELAAGHPVLLGVKIYPTEHPQWNLDHFVLAAGCDRDSLTLNTTWGTQETRSDALLASQKEGLSLANRSAAYYGYSITGLRSAPAASKPVRIKIVRDGDKKVELHVCADGLESGKRYRIVKFTEMAAAQRPDGQGTLVRTFTADGPKAEVVEKIDLDDVRVYRLLTER